jgi:apolipoprotein D and lipocalin family protein
VAEGIAEIVRGGHGARLRVNFADAWLRKLGFAWADYWILRVDRDYDTALVGTPDRKHLWVLSRTPGIEPEMYRRMIDYARIEGYDVDRVLVTRQSDETPSPRSRRAARARQRDAATA